MLKGHIFGAAAVTALLPISLAVPVLGVNAYNAETAQVRINPDTPERTSLAVVVGDAVYGTDNMHEPRTALSVVKVYLGYWVLKNGEAEDLALVKPMIQISDNNATTRLDQKYPQAMREAIAELGLKDTRYFGKWGAMVTSAYDMATALAAIRQDPEAAVLLELMREAPDTTPSGFDQTSGTDSLPGAIGSKHGWMYSTPTTNSMTYGEGWVAAAMTQGSSETLTDDVHANITVTYPDVCHQPTPYRRLAGLLTMVNEGPSAPLARS
ncbi:serine hydrolase [Corynebacterium uterequi]|uniref:Beta-lactamase enzyme family n=1 Tax=Corynebacterium uterequi TaxID=1072256 RepID=A0A0G3HF27_9CORY|nr:serine hydrolase [Corynebacterium uterequi]AKK11335.1 Beta-lactamase enzyme family [Corynebacterium uterequi]